MQCVRACLQHAICVTGFFLISAFVSHGQTPAPTQQIPGPPSQLSPAGQKALDVFKSFNADVANARNRYQEGSRLLTEGTPESALKARAIFNDKLSSYSGLLTECNDTFDLALRAQDSLGMTSAQIEANRNLFHAIIKVDEKNNLFGIAQSYHLLGDFDDELKYQRLALAAIREVRHEKGTYASNLFHKLTEASLLGGIATTLSNLKRYDDSIASNEAAIELYTELQASITQLQSDLRQIGMEKVYDVVSGKSSIRFNQGMSFYIIGLVNINREKRTDAVKYFEKALAVFAPLSDETSVHQKAEVLSSIGGEYLVLFEPERALDYFDQALALYRQLGDVPGQTQTLTSKASVYKILGNENAANESYQRALDILMAADIKQDEPSQPRYLGRQLEYFRLNQIGVLYRSREENTKSIEYLEKALTLANSDPDHFKLPLSSLGGASGLIGDIYYTALSDKAKSRDYFEKAVELDRLAGDPRPLAFALRELGLWHLDDGNPKRALNLYDETLAIYESIGINDKDVFSQNYATTLSYLQRIQEELGNRPAAVFYGKLCVNAIQQERQHLADFDAETQQGYLAKSERPYRRLVSLLIAEGRISEAEQVLAMLKEKEVYSYVRLDRGVAAHLLQTVALTERERDVLAAYASQSEKLAGINEEFMRLSEERKTYGDQPFPELGRYSELKAKRDQQMMDFRKFLDDLGSRFPPEEKRSPEVDSSLQVLLKSANAPRTAAVSTIIGDQELTLVVTTRSFQRVHKVKVTEQELNRLVVDFRQSLLDAHSDPHPAGQKLYDILVKPIEADLAATSADTILWSLDGTLRYIPTAALWDAKNGYLVERFASVVLTLAGRGTMARPQTDRARWQALGVGVSQPTAGFIALPAVPDELDCIITDPVAKTVSVNPICRTGVIAGKKLLDEEFTLGNFETSLTRFPVVHIASHFALNPGYDKDSFMLLGGGDQRRFTVEKLRTETLNNLDLLVLSACNTATPNGEKANGVEIEGFGAVAQMQGAKAVLATLWSVADASTRDLMVKFYRYYAAGVISKAKAMRRAQLDLIHGNRRTTGAQERRDTEDLSSNADETAATGIRGTSAMRYSHPYFWSPFVLFGNWQ